MPNKPQQVESKNLTHIVNREQEIQYVRSLVDAIAHSNQKVKECIYNVYGIPGVGKTALIEEIKARYQGARDVRVLPIDFAAMAELTTLAEEQSGFLQKLRAEVSEHGPDRERVPDVDYTTADLGLFTEELSNQLSSDTSTAQVLLLLFDSCEQMSDELFVWIERYMFAKLLETDKVVAVLGSQIPLRWRRFRVRRRVEVKHLEALGKGDVQQQLPFKDPDEIVYHLTFGHPLATQALVAYLQSDEVHSSQQYDWLKKHQAEVSHHIIKHLKERLLGSRATNSSSARDNLMRILQFVAIFREFDPQLLAKVVLPRVDRDMYSPDDHNRAVQVVRQLLDTRLVSWSQAISAYILDPTLRRVIARELELNDREQYKRLHTAAEAYYDDIIRSRPGNRNSYFIEKYYHMLSAADTGGSVRQKGKDYTKTMRDFLKEYYYIEEPRYIYDEDGLKNMYTKLQNATELQQLLEKHGLKSTFLQEAFEKAIQTARPNDNILGKIKSSNVA